jgi:hypothetical protein
VEVLAPEAALPVHPGAYRTRRENIRIAGS